MAIDLNDEIRVWAGFTQKELNISGGILIALFFICVLGITRTTGSIVAGVAVFGVFAAPTVGFVLYQRDLPKGYLLRRFKQEGLFLFLRFKNVKGIDVYAPPAVKRAEAWAKDFGTEDDTNGN